MKNLTKLLSVAFAATLFLTSCAPAAKAPVEGNRDSTPIVRQATADGTDVITGNVSIVDISNISQGYFMVQYTGQYDAIKLQLRSEGNPEPYTYDLAADGEYYTFPITTGSGNYTLTINENIDGNYYAVVDTATFSVNLESDFTPFLFPNQYVNFTEESDVASIGQEIATGAVDDLDVVNRVYDYVIHNIAYDTEKAVSVQDFYLPDVDETLATKKGICYDFASLMTSLLRTQNIPSQLVIGYAGTTYHAWISVHTPETGWIDNMIEFDGEDWERLDPTFAATSSDNPELAEYVGDGTNYNALYFY